MTIQHTIQTLFEAQVEQKAHHPAVVFAGHSITYAKLNEKANQLARYLRILGVKQETQVALCMERSITLLITILGILKAGGAYVPLDPSHPEKRLLLILHDNNIPYLIVNTELTAKVIHYQGRLIVLDNDKKAINKQTIENLNCHDPNLMITPQNLAYVLYTSGSTGTPKGVMIEHKSVVNYGLWFADYCNPIQPIDFSSNYVFDMAVTTSIVPLMLGLTIIICDDCIKKSPKAYLQYLKNNKISVIKLTPSYFKLLVHEIKNDAVVLPHLKTIILGGEHLASFDCIAWLKIYPHHNLFNEYGPTETTVAVSQYKICHANFSSLGINVPIGKIGVNMTGHLLDTNKLPVLDGEIGELYIGGLGLARGYLNQSELTSKQFIKYHLNQDNHERLYKTGDLCRQLPNGEMEYIGRIDDQIKIRGFRIEPGEIETHLVNHPAIDAAIVLARQDSLDKQYPGEKRLIAYYLLKRMVTKANTFSNSYCIYHTKKQTKVFAKPLQDLSDFQEQQSSELCTSQQPKFINARSIRHYLRKHLPDHMIPAAFVRLDTFPLTANGKLDKGALPIPRFIDNQHYLAPSTELQKMLAVIWAEELKLQPIGLTDDFFELGGHSLSAARILSKINHMLGKNISLEEFYHAPTIMKLTSIIGQIELNNVNALDIATIDHYNDHQSHTFQLLYSNKTNYATSSYIPLSDFQFLLWLSNKFEPKAKKINIIKRKRVQGRLDLTALTFAFDAIFKKHEILFYHVLKFRPIQELQKNLSFNIIVNNFDSLSEQDCEQALNVSLNQLIHYYPWHQASPMIIARLFYLKNNVSELQFSMPHIVCDDMSPDILLYHLSSFYLLYKERITIGELHIDKKYRDYIANEQQYFQANLDRDALFWEEYLKDARLFTFPSECVVKDMDVLQLSYSTYLEIPEQGLNNLQQFCAHNHVSINDGLCAALVLTLFNCCNNYLQSSTIMQQHIFMNIVKSTRDNQHYDETLGCFLKLEPINIKINKNSNLTNLSKQVHQYTIDTSLYQRCPSLVKLASLNTFCYKKNHAIQSVIQYLINIISQLYAIVFCSLKSNRRLNSKIFKLCGRLALFERQNNFLININVQSNFITTNANKKVDNLFGLTTQKLSQYQYDLLKIDHCFDVCFLRNDHPNTPYLVISANLQPTFRELIAKELIRVISSETSGYALDN